MTTIAYDSLKLYRIKKSKKQEESLRQGTFRELLKIYESKELKNFIDENIKKTKNVCGGAPVVAGTRVTVENICNCFDELQDLKAVLKEFPTLKDESQVAAALIYWVKDRLKKDLIFQLERLIS